MIPLDEARAFVLDVQVAIRPAKPFAFGLWRGTRTLVFGPRLGVGGDRTGSRRP